MMEFTTFVVILGGFILGLESSKSTQKEKNSFNLNLLLALSILTVSFITLKVFIKINTVLMLIYYLIVWIFISEVIFRLNKKVKNPKWGLIIKLKFEAFYLSFVTILNFIFVFFMGRNTYFWLKENYTTFLQVIGNILLYTFIIVIGCFIIYSFMYWNKKALTKK
jgi:hypothetical protein